MDEEIIDFSESYRDKGDDESLVEYYIDIRNDLGDSNIRNIKAAWNHFLQFKKERKISMEEVDTGTAEDFVEYLRNHDNYSKDNSVQDSLRSISAMLNWLNKKGIVAGNPFGEASKTMDFETSSPPKMELTNDQLRGGVSDIMHPSELIIVVALLKTGIRIAELHNLDERDINIDHPISSELDAPRPRLAGKPNSLFIDSRIKEGKVVNGEKRSNPNKRKSTRVIPLDPEVVDVLGWYLAQRPLPSSEARPLLTLPGKTGRKANLGDRMGIQAIRQRFQRWSADHGWYNPDETGSVKPHWCRHWFTTKIRSNTNKDLIKVGTQEDFVDFLRGDTSSETRDEYIQMTWTGGDNNWMRKAVTDAMPQLLTETPEHIERVQNIL